MVTFLSHVARPWADICSLARTRRLSRTRFSYLSNSSELAVYPDMGMGRHRGVDNRPVRFSSDEFVRESNPLNLHLVYIISLSACGSTRLTRLKELRSASFPRRLSRAPAFEFVRGGVLSCVLYGRYAAESSRDSVFRGYCSCHSATNSNVFTEQYIWDFNRITLYPHF